MLFAAEGLVEDIYPQMFMELKKKKNKKKPRGDKLNIQPGDTGRTEV